MKNISIILISLITLASCHKHEPVIDNSLKVGNILCSDGSILNPSLVKSYAKNPIGVIFWRNDYKDASITDQAYAVAIEDIGEDYLIDIVENISKVSEDEAKFDGSSNTSALITFCIENNINSPVIKKVVSYNPYNVSGWFLPSVAQAKELSFRIQEITPSLEKIGGKGFSGWYWTSTEDGNGSQSPLIYNLIISYKENRVTNSIKSNKLLIRPIIAIR